MTGSELTVFLVAFACEPDRGSEPGVGWVFLEALAEASRAEGWRAVVVTRPHRRARIIEALWERGHEHVQVMTVRVPRLLHVRGARDVRIASVAWQWRAVRAVRSRIRDLRGPVVVHHVTFATEGVPNFEHRLRPAAALVFGPAGSTAEGGDRSAARRLRRVIGAMALRTSDLLLATSEQVADSWRTQTRAVVVVEPNIVVEPLQQGPVEWDVAVVGQLIARKRVDLALRALALVDEARTIAVVGDGPLRTELEALRDSLGLADRVRFVGALHRDPTLAILTRTRLLLHTSRQEGAGWVIGEAQAAGAFVVAVAGTGADDAARRAPSAIATTARAEAVADALRIGLAADRATPSDRWSRRRLPGMMREWYATALLAASDRGLDR